MNAIMNRLGLIASIDEHAEGYNVTVAVIFYGGEDDIGEIVLRRVVGSSPDLGGAIMIYKSLPAEITKPEQFSAYVYRAEQALRDRPREAFKVVVYEENKMRMRSILAPRIEYRIDELYSHPVLHYANIGIYIHECLTDAREHALKWAYMLHCRTAILRCDVACITANLDGERMTDALVPRELIEVI